MRHHGQRNIVQRFRLAIDFGDSIDNQMGRHFFRFRSRKISTSRIRPAENRKMKEPAAFVSGFKPPRSRLQMTTGKVTSKRVLRKAIRNSSQERVKHRQKAAIRAGAIIGAVMLSRTRAVEAPRSRAADSIL